MALADNVQAGKAIKQLLNFLAGTVDEVQDPTDDDVLQLVDCLAGIDPLLFWKRLAEELAAKQGLRLSQTPSAVDPMDYNEALAFENVALPWATEMRVRDLGADYLDKVTNSPFNRKLRRYVASARFQQVQGFKERWTRPGVAVD